MPRRNHLMFFQKAKLFYLRILLNNISMFTYAGAPAYPHFFASPVTLTLLLTPGPYTLAPFSYFPDDCIKPYLSIKDIIPQNQTNRLSRNKFRNLDPGSGSIC